MFKKNQNIPYTIILSTCIYTHNCKTNLINYCRKKSDLKEIANNSNCPQTVIIVYVVVQSALQAQYDLHTQEVKKEKKTTYYTRTTLLLSVRRQARK